MKALLHGTVIATMLAGGVLAAAPQRAQAQQLPYSFCTLFADRTISIFYRMHRGKCGKYQNLNMDWDVHFRWCEAQGRQKSIANLKLKDQAFDQCQ
jgi:hypothetical protein